MLISVHDAKGKAFTSYDNKIVVELVIQVHGDDTGTKRRSQSEKENGPEPGHGKYELKLELLLAGYK